MSESGANPSLLARSLHVRGSPAWSPDGNWIAVSGDDGKGSGLFKAPAEDGPPVRLRSGLCFNPIWSPDGRFILYSEPLAGGELLVKALAPDGAPVPLPDLRVGYNRASYRFLPGGTELVMSRGGQLWLIDLATGRQRQLTELPPGLVSTDFDIRPDGKQIIFGHIRDSSDIVLIELERR
jgi:Tol biopolymer transport system component